VRAGPPTVERSLHEFLGEECHKQGRNSGEGQKQGVWLGWIGPVGTWRAGRKTCASVCLRDDISCTRVGACISKRRGKAAPDECGSDGG
jgi:hypothetical protein